MRAYLEYVIDINAKHWGNGIIQWMFYLGILLILILSKNKHVKIAFAGLPLVYLLIIFFPGFHSLLVFAGVGSWHYYVRLYSFIPTLYPIAYGITLFLKRTRNQLKMVLLIVVCAFIAVFGTNVYCMDWMKPAMNKAKVPGDVFEIKALFSGSPDRVCVAAIDPLTTYIRQVAPELLTPYARNMEELGNWLMMSSPNVPEIMEAAGRQAVDYVIAPQSSESSFQAAGHYPFAQTTNYFIYKVEGVNKVSRILNERQQIVSKTTFDSDGGTVKQFDGYTTIKYEYDDRGYSAGMCFCDEAGKPVENELGIASVEFPKTSRGMFKKIIYRDRNGNPVMVNGRFETRYAYKGMAGKRIVESYYDENGKPMNRTDTRYAVKETQLDLSDRYLGECYYDVSGKRTTGLTTRYARSKRVYDGAQIVEESYYDENDNLLSIMNQSSSKRTECMSYTIQEDGVGRDEDNVVFTTRETDNHLSHTEFQLWTTEGSYLCSFGFIAESGPCQGRYIHEFPSGLYLLRFKANGSLKDEYMTCLEYLEAGETIFYRYNVDRIEPKCLTVSGFYIGRQG